MKNYCVVVTLSVMCAYVQGITNEHHQALVSVVQKAKELKGEDQRDPPPEYYRGSGAPTSSSPTSYDRDRYGNSLNRYGEKDFITSQGGSRFISSSPSNPSSYGNRDRIGSGTSFGSWSSSTGNSDSSRYGGSYGSSNSDRYNNAGYQTGSNRYGYIPGGTYDSTRPSYGPPMPIDPHSSYNPSNTYNIHGTSQFPDFQISDSGYDNNGWNNGYGTPTRGKDLTKKLLLPLAGAAILGVAAALVASPLLLQVGVAHGKRKRRDTTFDQAQTLAYKGQSMNDHQVHH